MFMLAFAVFAGIQEPAGPWEFGKREIEAAVRVQAPSSEVPIRRKHDKGLPPEAFRVAFGKAAIEVASSDDRGAMYGALDAAERLAAAKLSELAGKEFRGSPKFADRGWNLFLPLPWDYLANRIDPSPEALADPKRWFFHDEDYWRTLLDQMARSRLNWLDIHGPYDLDTTRFPNLFAYFVSSAKYPLVGPSPEVKAKNLTQLRKVIDMAHARGIRVSLMSYEARFDTPHNPSPPYAATEENLYEYTQEVVAETIRKLPRLDALGFRIGESGRGPEFFRCYLDALKETDSPLPLLTRSWVTRKARVLPLAKSARDFTVQIKYNGEQWAAPYIMAGGRTGEWYSYFWEDYLSDWGREGAAASWRGRPIEKGAWPSQPYKVVWQVRDNGTHRIFPIFQPQWIRRSIEAMDLGTTSGFTVEPLSAYFPQSPAYYSQRPSAFRWIHQRDELFMMQWGRLGYDPSTPEDVFVRALGRKFQLRNPEALAVAWSNLSRIIPVAFLAYSIGPDHRSHAPELEWGGSVESFLERDPFDSHVFRSPRETVAAKTLGAGDGRIGFEEAADLLDLLRSRAAPAFRTLEWGDSPGSGLAEIGVALRQLDRLGAYYAARFRGALAYARFQSSGERSDLEDAARQACAAYEAWDQLANSPDGHSYRPFTDRLRMRTHDFHWSLELPKLLAERQRFLELAGWTQPQLPRPLIRDWAEPPRHAKLTWDEADGKITARISSEGIRRAWLLHKPLPSSTFFHKLPMEQRDGHFVASIHRLPAGHALAAEIETSYRVWRVPWWLHERPYLVVPSKPQRTPPYFSSEEALAHLDPRSLDPQEHGWLVVSSRGWSFFSRFPSAQRRKLLEPLAKGMKMLILQQDFASGRYSLDFLGESPDFESRRVGVFEPGGALGLERIEDPEILWQPMRAQADWEVFGNGGVARKKVGKGEVWVVQARLLQRLHLPAASRSLAALVRQTAASGPAILLDTGTEGGDYVTSVLPDFYNSLGLSFLTLGEVVASEQGLRAFEPVAAPKSDQSVMEGRGPAMMAAFLKEKVEAAAARPVPSSVAEFEIERERRRRELMRSLGLDPLPPRTPLNAQVTGVVQRAGYRIEKLLFESRPQFFVTANLYLPDPLPQGKLPVIVNPHGHWQHKKQEPVVQTRAISQALAGYLAVVVDSPGHSFEGGAPVERRFAGTHNDLRLLLGSMNTTSVYVWDLVRTLDYLETRPEADMTRVGITGASGGGLATAYAFAAEPRFTCAVPVVYASSLEVNANNGCLCNHVPATLQVGDRADVLAIRAPKPVFVIGAQDDPEFPPEGTKRTGEKLKETYALLGKEGLSQYRVFDGPHDYNRAMREAAMGFFDLHLRRRGNGTPVPEPTIQPEPAGSESLRVVAEEIEGRSMLDLAREALASAPPTTWDDTVALNGGLPLPVPLDWTEERSSEGKTYASFESESGLRVPAVIWTPGAQAKAVVVLISEGGKVRAQQEFDVERLVQSGLAVMAIDVRGFGELPGLDARLMAYLGTADPFAMAWDAARAAVAAQRFANRVVLAGKGTAASQIVLFAALMEPTIDRVLGIEGLRGFADAFDAHVPTYSVMPRADLSASLATLRQKVGARGVWTFLGDRPLDPTEAVLDLLRP